MRTLTYYFDFLSPYSYFAWTWIGDFCAAHGLALEPRPVLLAALLGHHGQLGPAEIPAKREFVFRDCVRWANLNGVPYAMPKTHPFNPLMALRAATREGAGTEQLRVIDALWKAGWQQGVDMASAEDLARALDEAGLDGAALLGRTSETVVKDALKRNTADAISRGVFGVPTFVVDDEVFWGNDQRPHLERWVRDAERGYDPEVVRQFLAREAAATRQR